ncbi:hypothetical protein [Mycobacterium shigaense]|uniref:hypothetical protein n=1 Tax=Mycobacterium shigaense TaxID=722731 RepID=UPI002AE03900|nr:hypothetical protein [Mycobacterium shigaense]MEA1123885.1 hypothetical protein [Mycobacterium shigaense]
MTSVVIYCDGPDDGPRHDRCPVARYEKPYRVGGEEHEKWGPVRKWREQDSDSVISVPEFEREVTDDDDESRAANLSLHRMRRQFRYDCPVCPLDLQRHTYNLKFDIQAAHQHTLDAIAEAGRSEIFLREFMSLWKFQISKTRR